MSYCVNCGVELHATAKACPLCSTKVYHPEKPPATDLPTPYPTKKGQVEIAKNKEFTILMSIVLFTTAVVCVILNLFSIQIGRWSLYVVGICAMLWIFLVPFFFPKKSNVYLNIALNGLSIALFLGMVSYLHPNNQWYEHIALPIILLGTLLLEIISIFAIRMKSSMLVKTAVSMAAIGVICTAIEMVIDLHLRECYHLGWSAIVLTCCIVIDIILTTIYLREGLRSEVRRRMHF